MEAMLNYLMAVIFVPRFVEMDEAEDCTDLKHLYKRRKTIEFFTIYHPELKNVHRQPLIIR